MNIKAMPGRTWKFPKTAGASDPLFPFWITLVFLFILDANLIDAGTKALKGGSHGAF